MDVKPSHMEGGKTRRVKETEDSDTGARKESSKELICPKRSFQGKSFTLSNGMQIVEITDPTVAQTSVALLVGAGTFHQPAVAMGLPHFLEHMLFMGSEEFPGEATFMTTVNAYGGYSNAYTANDHTMYYYSCTPDGLLVTLPIFAAMFAHPLLSADGVDREMQAVQAEHEKNLKNTAWLFRRASQLSLDDPTHPKALFGTGCVESLKQPNILKLLRKFFETYYVASNMTVCVIHDGRRTVPFEALFAGMSTQVVGKVSIPQPMFRHPNHTKFQLVKTYEPSVDVVMQWCIEGVDSKACQGFRVAYDVLSLMLRYDGKNSITQALRLDLGVHQWYMTMTCESETIIVTLVIELGESPVHAKNPSHVHRVMQAVLSLFRQCIELLQVLDTQTVENIFQRMRAIDESAFECMVTMHTADDACEYTRNAWIHDAIYAACPPTMSLPAFPTKAWATLLRALSRPPQVIQVGTSHPAVLTYFLDEIDTQLTQDHWYDISVHNGMWKSSSALKPIPVRTMTIYHKLPKLAIMKDVYREGNPPLKVIDKNTHEVWLNVHSPHTLGTNRMTVLIQKRILEEGFEEDVQSKLAMQVWSIYIIKIVQRDLYAYLTSGMGVSISSFGIYMRISIHGWSYIMLEFLQRVLSIMDDFTMQDSEMTTQAIQQIQEELGQHKYRMNNDIAQDLLLEDVIMHRVQPEAMERCLSSFYEKSLSTTDIQRVLNQCTSRHCNDMPCYTVILLSGMVHVHDVQPFVDVIEEKWHMSGETENTKHLLQWHTADKCTRNDTIHFQPSLKQDHNHVTVLCMQRYVAATEQHTVVQDNASQTLTDQEKMNICMGMVASILKRTFFDVLRTKEQYGYIVNCAHMWHSVSSSIVFTVVSPTKHSDVIQARITKFIKDTTLDKATFVSTQAAYLQDMTSSPSFNDEVDQAWSGIQDRQRFFKQRLAYEFVDGITFDDMLAFYKHYIQSPKQPRFWICSEVSVK